MFFFNRKLGGLGEQSAELFLKEKGYRILDTNYYTPFGELDIVGIDGDALVFVEVKTRSSLSCGVPGESITNRKKNNLVKSALFYLGQKHYEFSTYRFDAVSVNCKKKSDIELIKNAFDLDSRFSF